MLSLGILKQLLKIQCETRSKAINVLAGVSSSVKRERETQKASLTSRVAVRHQGVDTGDLKQGIQRMSVATQTQLEKAGIGGERRPLREVGHGEVEQERDKIPGGWEWIWVEDPWTGRSERVKVPREEAGKSLKKWECLTTLSIS